MVSVSALDCFEFLQSLGNAGDGSWGYGGPVVGGEAGFRWRTGDSVGCNAVGCVLCTVEARDVLVLNGLCPVSLLSPYSS